jgi:hypothetical protein
MKVKLRIYDGNENLLRELFLAEEYQIKKKVDEDIIFFEDRKYRFEVEYLIEATDRNLSLGPATLLINDIPYKMYDEDINVYSTATTRFFAIFYGLTSINIYITCKNNEEIYFTSPYFKIATRKQSKNSIQSMLREIDSFDPDILENCFSKSVNYVGEESIRKSPADIIQMHQRILYTYKKYIPFFRNGAKKHLKNIYKEVDASRASNIGYDEIEWIARNLQNLKRYDIETGIRLNGKYYLPNKIMTKTKKVTADIYENRMIITILKMLKNSLISLKEDLNKELELLENKTFSYELPEGYIIPDDIPDEYFHYKYKQQINTINILEKEYDKLFVIYSSILKCEPELRIKKLKYTQTFRNVKHYRAIFEIANEWIEKYRKYSLFGDTYLIRLKSLPKIYEFYCLIRVLKSFYSLGYILKDIKKETYGEDSIELNNIYILENPNLDFKATIFYEPIIDYRPEKNKYIELYKLKKGGRYTFYKPDFIIKLDTKYKESIYGILDAKYSRKDIIQKYQINKLTMNYLHLIGSTKGPILPVAFLYMLYPGEGDYIENEQSTYDDRAVYPRIGTIKLSPEVREYDFENITNQLHNYLIGYYNWLYDTNLSTIHKDVSLLSNAK